MKNITELPIFESIKELIFNLQQLKELKDDIESLEERAGCFTDLDSQCQLDEFEFTLKRRLKYILEGCDHDAIINDFDQMDVIRPKLDEKDFCKICAKRYCTCR